MVQEGDMLPSFELPDQEGRTRTLADLAGPAGLVLYVYPKDDTPGCTVEANDFRDLAGDFEARGYRIAGVSPDPAESHCEFIAKHGLSFPLLTDADHSYLRQIGGYGEKQNYGRTYEGVIRSTFVAAPDGKVRKAYHNVRAKGHAARVLRDLG